MIRPLVLSFALSFLICPAFAQTPAAPPVVAELFTSQGCAFCPPADKLLGRIAEQQGVIALACHVDYFGVRKNSLGKPFCTQRQTDYNKLIGKGPRYTPQLVVNGHMDMIGYEADKVNAAILKARAEKLAPVAISGQDNGTFVATLPQSEREMSAHLWLAVFDSPRSMAMTEGGNFGKTLTYYNVVSRMDDLGPWDGRALSIPLAPDLSSKNAGFAIIAQDAVTGRILAAGSAQNTGFIPLASAP